MKVLVTGAAGFLGSNLVVRLLADGCDVVGLDDLSYGSMRNLAAAKGGARFRFVRGDVRDPATVVAAAEGATAVVHLAAGKIPRYGDALTTLDVNLLGGRNALEACRVHRARFVLASTSDCYGDSPDQPLREDGRSYLGASNVPRWSYAVSKLAEEHLAFAHREAHGTGVVVLRLFGGYGENQDLTWRGGPQSVFLEAALRGDEMQVHGDGLQTRSFTYVADTVRALASAITATDAVGEVVNVGIAEETTIRALAERIWQICRPGTEPRIRYVPYATFGRYEDVRRRVPDTTKARRVLGFDAVVPLAEGLPRTALWHAAALGLPWPAAG